MSITLSDAIADYIAKRKQDKLLSLQKDRDKAWAATDDEKEQAVILSDYSAKETQIAQQFATCYWLTEKAQQAVNFILATHVAKYTHSSSKGSNILMTIEVPQYHYLVTTKLTQPRLDFAVLNASFLDVVGLLKVTVNNESLLTQLQQGNIKALHAFTQDVVLLQQWLEGFLNVLSTKQPRSDILSKQVYFPVNSSSIERDYHLLCPLFSSSLAQALYLQVQNTRFGTSKEVRTAHKERRYHPLRDQIFPRTAVQHFGGKNKQNISLLNSERYGQSYLLNCAPPNYQPQVTPPLTMRTIFNHRFTWNNVRLISDFKWFLEREYARQSNFETRYTRDYQFLIPIIEQLLSYAASLQGMEQHQGWSEQATLLKREHKLWLDSANPAVSFQEERQQGDWLSVIAEDFTLWLKRQLNSDKYQLGDVEHNYIKKVCLLELKKFEWRRCTRQEKPV